MKTNFLICAAVALSFFLSCSTEIDQKNINISTEGRTVSLLNIDQITEVPQFLAWHTKLKTEHFLSMGLHAEVERSMLISYSDSPIKAIFTKLNSVNDRPDENFHVYFMLDNLVSVFDIIIQSEYIGQKICRYTFLNRFGEKIGLFEIDQEDGKILNTVTGFTRSKKDWFDRFENCIEWTIDNMNTFDKMACFAIGPVCAGAIASMCAIGASEGKFETPANP